MQEGPELEFGLDLYFVAYMELSSCRGLGFGAQSSIPWTAVRDYCDEYGIAGAQREAMFYLIRQMDGAFHKHQASTMPKPPT